MSPIIRINNGALRLGGSKLTLGTGPLTLPFQANLRHWYDFTDTQSLWQDTGLSTQITANGQSIKGVTDKGSNLLDLIEEETPRTFDSTTFAWSTAQGSGNLNATFSSYSFAPPQTFFVIYRNTGTSLGIVYHIGNTAGWEYRADGNFRPQDFYNSVGGQFTVADSTDTWYAYMQIARANSTQSMWHSNTVGEKTSSIGAKTITVGGTVIGAFNSGNSSTHLGDIAEVGAWNIDDGDEATLFADFKAYTEEKYSIVWA